ncbi:hypothetical protein AcV7_003863 [Taiwanofungus camphoratus]|nr:hypothetical protein AcV7_003863 [Antrodia cinnamomea]
MPAHLQSGNRNLPRRVDSLANSKGPFFTELEEELLDIKRVNTHGQEEDLKMALSRMICRVEELTSMLKDAFKAQTDSQTELTLAKSNLQLALANNEMLEDALKRDAGGHARDVGWRRWSAREQQERQAEEDRRRSVDSAGSHDVALASPVPQSQPSPNPTSPLPHSASVASQAPSSDSRFFRFRFGSGSATSGQSPSSPRVPALNGSQSPKVNGQAQASHLTSASLPSLVPTRDREKELEDMTAELKREREARAVAFKEKASLEAELESLSQALFEEAQKMVVIERRKLADTEDELRETQSEREALRRALRLMESQSRQADVGDTAHTLGESVLDSSLSRVHVRKRSSSSAMGVKSLPSSLPSSPNSEKLDTDEALTSAGTVVASHSYRPPPVSILNPDSPPLSSSLSSSPNIRETQPRTEGSSSPTEPLPSLPSEIQSPSIDQYVYPFGQTVDYLPGEESPWADVESAGNSPQPKI